MITLLIILAEISFWIFIVAGLFARYVWKREKLSWYFFAMVPIIDLMLLLLTYFDLRAGAIATSAHGIAVIYIGCSIAFGKQMIEWADVRFQYYVLKTGFLPKKKVGMERRKQEIKGWLKHVYAYVIGNAFLWIMIFSLGLDEQTIALFHTSKFWTFILAIDLLVSLSYIIAPPKA